MLAVRMARAQRQPKPVAVRERAEKYPRARLDVRRVEPPERQDMTK